MQQSQALKSQPSLLFHMQTEIQQGREKEGNAQKFWGLHNPKTKMVIMVEWWWSGSLRVRSNNRFHSEHKLGNGEEYFFLSSLETSLPFSKFSFWNVCDGKKMNPTLCFPPSSSRSRLTSLSLSQTFTSSLYFTKNWICAFCVGVRSGHSFILKVKWRA